MKWQLFTVVFSVAASLACTSARGKEARATIIYDDRVSEIGAANEEPRSREREFVRNGAGKSWFNLVAFAQLVEQPIAHDEGLSVWYFGLRSDQRLVLSSLKAPDFTLPDMNGKTHSLSDFRGRKVLLLTWASW